MAQTQLTIRPQKVLAALRRVGPLFHKGVSDGMVQAVQSVVDPLMTVTPLDTGLTRGSFAAFDGDHRVFVSPWGPLAGKAAAVDHGLPLPPGKRYLVLTFNTYYSAVIHEGTHIHFRTPGTQAKFLESVFYAYANQLVQIIGESAQRAMTGVIL